MSRARAAVLTVVLATGGAALALAQEGAEERFEADHVKVGQRYSWRLTAGNASTWEVVSRTEDEVVYKVRLTIGGKELPDAQTGRFPLRRKRADGAGARARHLDGETLTISGIAFPCTVTETETGGTTLRTWRSRRFPEVIKVQMGKDVTAELVEIRAPGK